METGWITEDDLIPRIDAEYYGSSFVAAQERLERSVDSQPFESLWSDANRIYIGIAGFEVVDSPRDFTPYLRPVDISDEGWINYSRLAWCKKEWLVDHERNGCAQPGDLIVEVKGYTRKVAIVSKAIPDRCVVSGSSYRVQLKQEYDPYYVFAYLRSPTGQLLKRRMVSNTAISYIDPDSFRAYRIPVPESPIQMSIGHQVRAAEQLRADADSALSQAVEELNSPFGSATFDSLEPDPKGGCEHFTDFITPEELDSFWGAQFFAPKRARAVAMVRSTGIDQRIGAHGSRVRSTRVHDSAFRHVDPSSVSSSDGFWSLVGQESDAADAVLAQPNHVLFLRMRSYLNKTTINDTRDSVTVSPEVFVYEFGEEAFYIALCLRQPWALAQVAELGTGDRPRVDSEFVDDVVVPWPEESTRREIGQLFAQSFILRRRSDELVQKAVGDIEKLIDGVLDQRDCVENGVRLSNEFGLEMPK